MDWSLVLVSQGIEASIEYCEETGAWALGVPAADHDRALASIRQYRIENRRWPWQREVPLPDFVFDAGSLAWVVLNVCFYALSEQDAHFRAAGVMDVAAISHGQWWRLFTAMFLHGDLAHLSTNAAIGFVLLGLVMGRYGTGVGVLAALLAGAAGNVLVWWLCAAPRAGLGASGLVLGALGLLAAQTVAAWRGSFRPPRVVIVGLAGGLMLFTLLGLSPGTDVLAHSGGFVAGVGVGAGLVFAPKLQRNGLVNLLAGLVFTALVVVSWWLALR